MVARARARAEKEDPTNRTCGNGSSGVGHSLKMKCGRREDLWLVDKRHDLPPVDDLKEEEKKEVVNRDWFISAQTVRA